MPLHYIFILKIKLKPNNLPKYFTSSIKYQLNCIRTLRKKKLRSTTDYNTGYLLEAELRLSRDIVQAKSNYESKLIQDLACHNQSRIYQCIRSLRKADALPPLVIYNDSIASYDTIKASLFNRCFCSVFTTSHINPPNDDDVIDTSAINHIISISICQDEVYIALVTLYHSKATGIDGIVPKILKYCTSALFKPLYYLYSLILRKHTIPIHCIIPVFKSGEKALVTNYSPISLLCNASKILKH